MTSSLSYLSISIVLFVIGGELSVTMKTSNAEGHLFGTKTSNRRGIIDNPETKVANVELEEKVPIMEDGASRNMPRRFVNLWIKEQFITKSEEKLNVPRASAPCKTYFTNESSLSLRSLFHAPAGIRRVANCSNRKKIASKILEEPGQYWVINERSIDSIGSEYVLDTILDKNEIRRLSLKRRRNANESGSNEQAIRKDEFGKAIVQEASARKYENTIQNPAWHSLMDRHDLNRNNATENPWPLVPGPISCDLDFPIRPSFVAKLGEFDYVVSVQRQRNPYEPTGHACTGVIYNSRFVVVAPHCLNDNYGLSVTSTDDLCTIDEMIDVDYVIEHKNYDPETRRNDIALIKLKSEIHKRAGKFPWEADGAPGQLFYAVGFGELMWKSFPDRVSKLLQKVPVRRYLDIPKETPGTLHITTSHMDLTGVFRGDFGGALINTQGEFVGLKSKFVKRKTEWEIYTRIGTYLPWIKSMVALHGSW